MAYNPSVMQLPLEANYPLTFRTADAAALGQLLRQDGSVTLIGIKRVGISNFLRFFLYHPEVAHQQIKLGPRCFVQVDLNSLVEQTALAFWQVTLKRLIDVVERTAVPASLQQRAEQLFAESIQLHDLLFTLEAIQRIIRELAELGYYTTIVFIRFDRFPEVLTAELLANLLALKGAGGVHVSYIFTSCRPLPEIQPAVFTKAELAVFVRELYLKPAPETDAQIMLQTFLDRYELHLSPSLQAMVRQLAGGHVQYLHLIVLKLRQHAPAIKTARQLQTWLASDEELRLLSEEVWETLTPAEQQQLQQLVAVPTAIPTSGYLLDSGLVTAHGLFSPLFGEYVRHRLQDNEPDTTELPDRPELTKKEHLLFSLLVGQLGEIIDRDQISLAVWPEQVEGGVSDWAIDRLVARLRSKLRAQRSEFSIITVVSRGHKLVKLS